MLINTPVRYKESDTHSIPYHSIMICVLDLILVAFIYVIEIYIK